MCEFQYWSVLGSSVLNGHSSIAVDEGPRLLADQLQCYTTYNNLTKPSPMVTVTVTSLSTQGVDVTKSRMGQIVRDSYRYGHTASIQRRGVQWLSKLGRGVATRTKNMVALCNLVCVI